MTFVNVNPRRKVKRSSSIFDNLFNELMNTNLAEHSKNHLISNRPAVNVIENNDSFQIALTVPGLSKKDISIGVEKNILSIEANKEVNAPEGEKFIKQEFNFNKFKRTFRLPKTIDTTNISATFDNGILNILLAKKEEAKEQAPRNIEIK